MRAVISSVPAVFCARVAWKKHTKVAAMANEIPVALLMPEILTDCSQGRHRNHPMCCLNHPPARVLEQSEDGFDRNPRSDHSLRAVARRNELPAAYCFQRAFIEAEADAFNHPNIVRPPIRSYKNHQRHRALHLAVPRFIGVRRIRAIRTGWLNGPRSV